MSNSRQHFLVIQTASIGDVILVTPVIEALHGLYPDALVDVLVKKGNDELFQGHPFLNRVLVWNKASGKYRALCRLALQIRKQGYDGVFNAQRFFSSGLLTVCSGARLTSGFSKNPLSRFFRYRLPHALDGLHEADRNLRLIPQYHAGPGSARIRLYPSKEDKEKIIPYQAATYLTVSPASLWFTKQYPAQKWISFLDHVPSEIQVFLLGGKQDIALNESILAGTKHSLCGNLAGKLSLLQSAALMKDALMNYVNDSAPLHLCSAVQAPVAAVFCSTVADFGFGPYAANGSIIQTEKHLDCRPCGIHGLASCPRQHFQCALSISYEQLLNKLPDERRNTTVPQGS